MSSGTVFNNGIAASTIEGGSGDDKITGFANRIGGGFSYGITGSNIKGGSGNDEITGNGGSGEFDNGIFTSTIEGGDGDDLITGNGADDGIESSTIDGGSGNDVITCNASGIGGTGISNSTIDGGSGDDTFDLQSGTGTVMGGGDEDLLILEGLKSDYTFTQIAGVTLGVNMTRDSTSTDLTVSELELFQFASAPETTFAYADLFV
jgi:Ca2+-binding RTX toxin-like protein